MSSQISIHALLAESDSTFLSFLILYSNFYPRSPCGERRTATATLGRSERFLSTLSLRRATTQNGYIIIAVTHFYPRSPCGERRISGTARAILTHFYPRSPCGERHLAAAACPEDVEISIHALLAESDQVFRYRSINTPRFLSTLSLRRATRQGPAGCRHQGISIHALLAESDPVPVRWFY